MYMAKKNTVLNDELGIKSNGIYCIMPFERRDKNNKAVFKIGMAIKTINRRMENYHTTFPMGFYYVAILEQPTKKRSLRDIYTYYREIEQFIFKYITDEGAKRITSTTRINSGGNTEWFYTDEDLIHEAFVKAQNIYGGKIDLSSLDGINKNAKKNEARKKKYLGEIVFFV